MEKMTEAEFVAKAERDELEAKLAHAEKLAKQWEAHASLAADRGWGATSNRFRAAADSWSRAADQLRGELKAHDSGRRMVRGR